MDRRSFLLTAGLVAGGGGVGLGRLTSGDTAEDWEYMRANRHVDLVVRVVEDDEQFEYIQDEDVVRYPAVKRSKNHVVEWSTMPWEEWVEMQALRAAGKEAAAYAGAEVGMELSSPITADVMGESIATVVTAHVEDEEELMLEGLAAVTPASVMVHYELDDRSATREIEIYVTVKSGEAIPL